MTPLKVIFPINNARSSEYYALMFEDANNVTHYFNFDGSYDGYSSDPCIDLESRTNMN